MSIIVNYKEDQRKLIIAIVPVRISEETEIEELIRDIGKVEEGLWFQLVNAKAVFSLKHLVFSSYASLKKYLSRESLTRNPHIELLMVLTGARQIGNAVNMAGISKDTKKAYLIVLSVNKERNYISEIIESYVKKHSLNVDKELIKTFNMKAPLATKITTEELKSTTGTSYAEKLEKNIMLKSLSVYFKF